MYYRSVCSLKSLNDAFTEILAQFLHYPIKIAFFLAYLCIVKLVGLGYYLYFVWQCLLAL